VRKFFAARVLAVLAALAVATLALVGATSGSAGAAAAVRAAVPSCVVGNDAVIPGPIVSISTTTPFPGQTVTISGANFDKNAHVSIVMTPPTVTLASVTTSATGTFTVQVTIPANITGTKTISIVGGAPAGCLPNSIVITIQTPATAPGNHLSNTGVDIFAGLLVALVLVCVGLFLTRTGRRRHEASHARHLS
jgi:hypothetical protein